MPYLHWDIEDELAKCKSFSSHLEAGRRKPKKSETQNQSPTILPIATPSNTLSDQNVESDHSLLDAYLYDNHPLHMRRTLDQYYYHTLLSTEKRDSDQVISRYQDRHNDESRKTPRIITMVDQLWLWVLVGPDGRADTVITSFPAPQCQRLKHNPGNLKNQNPDHNGATNVLSNILLHLLEEPGAVRTPYDLAGLIATECSKVYLNTADTRTPEVRFSEIYESSIGDIVCDLA